MTVQSTLMRYVEIRTSLARIPHAFSQQSLQVRKTLNSLIELIEEEFTFAQRISHLLTAFRHRLCLTLAFRTRFACDVDFVTFDLFSHRIFGHDSLDDFARRTIITLERPSDATTRTSESFLHILDRVFLRPNIKLLKFEIT